MSDLKQLKILEIVKIDPKDCCYTCIYFDNNDCDKNLLNEETSHSPDCDYYEED